MRLELYFLFIFHNNLLLLNICTNSIENLFTFFKLFSNFQLFQLFQLFHSFQTFFKFFFSNFFFQNFFFFKNSCCRSLLECSDGDNNKDCVCNPRTFCASKNVDGNGVCCNEKDIDSNGMCCARECLEWQDLNGNVRDFINLFS